MAYRKVVVQVHAHKKVRYKSEVVVEAPEGMEDGAILEAVLYFQDCLGIGWKEDEEDGDGIITDDEDWHPYVIAPGEPNQEPQIRLKRKKKGGLKAFYRT